MNNLYIKSFLFHTSYSSLKVFLSFKKIIHSFKNKSSKNMFNISHKMTLPISTANIIKSSIVYI